jgi:hypothetical protein
VGGVGRGSAWLLCNCTLQPLSSSASLIGMGMGGGRVSRLRRYGMDWAESLSQAG